jgi:hypothetical protein
VQLTFCATWLCFAGRTLQAATSVALDGHQCGGRFGPGCTNSGGTLQCLDAPWGFTACSAGVPCVRHTADYWQCRPTTWGK